MGSVGFCDIIDFPKGKNMSSRDAYAEAVSDAVAMYGSDPYNGTISTTDGFNTLTDRTMTRSGAEYVSVALEQGGIPPLAAFPFPYGRIADAIPVGDDEDFTFRKETFTVDVDNFASMWNGRDEEVPEFWRMEDKLEVMVRFHVLRDYGFRIHDVHVEEKLKTAIEVVKPDGAAVTKFVAKVGDFGKDVEFDTRAQAIAAVKKFLANGTFDTDITIRAVKRYADDAEAATVRRRVVSATAKVTVTVSQERDAPVTGWCFFGFAKC